MEPETFTARCPECGADCEWVATCVYVATSTGMLSHSEPKCGCGKEAAA